MKLVPKLSQSGEFTPVGSSSTLTTKRTTTYKNIASKAVLQSNDKNVQVPAVIAKDTPSTCNENGTNHSDLILLTAADVDRAVERNEDEILENEFGEYFVQNRTSYFSFLLNRMEWGLKIVIFRIFFEFDPKFNSTQPV